MPLPERVEGMKRAIQGYCRLKRSLARLPESPEIQLVRFLVNLYIEVQALACPAQAGQAQSCCWRSVSSAPRAVVHQPESHMWSTTTSSSAGGRPSANRKSASTHMRPSFIHRRTRRNKTGRIVPLFSSRMARCIQVSTTNKTPTGRRGLWIRAPTLRRYLLWNVNRDLLDVLVAFPRWGA